MDLCKVRAPRCGEWLTLVVAVDHHGNATSGFVREERSVEGDACIQSRLAGLLFLPARDCAGQAIAGEYVGKCTIICE
jgi:hypothetical protein